MQLIETKHALFQLQLNKPKKLTLTQIICLPVFKFTSFTVLIWLLPRWVLHTCSVCEELPSHLGPGFGVCSYLYNIVHLQMNGVICMGSLITKKGLCQKNYKCKKGIVHREDFDYVNRNSIRNIGCQSFYENPFSSGLNLYFMLYWEQAKPPLLR